MDADIIVIGGGTVGAAIAYGLAYREVRVLLLDGGDRDFRAANANFGLVWQQGKGLGLPAYQRLTRDSVKLWPNFRSGLEDATSIDLQYEKNGGLALCLSEADFASRAAFLRRLDEERDAAGPDWEMLSREDLTKAIPNVQFGPEVVGASYGSGDGHANPLRLLAALHAGVMSNGGRLRGASTVRSITREGDTGFTVDLGTEKATAARVVIAAGLGSKQLAAQVGLDIPIRPQRGQILVTERLAPFLPLPMTDLRQTQEGTVMIGATHDETGFDASTTTEAAAALSAMALRLLPALSEAKLVRQWAGLRILTPDSYPIYAESETHPGAFIAVCHSGVTLAAIHATTLADAIVSGRLPSSLDVFHHRRFDVSKVA